MIRSCCSVPAAGSGDHWRRDGGGGGFFCSSGGWNVVGRFDGGIWGGCCTCLRLEDCCIGCCCIAGRVLGSGRSVEGRRTRRGHNNGRCLAYRVKAIE